MAAVPVARRPWVGGNWKCNGTRESLTALIEAFNAGEVPADVDVVIAPTALHIPLALTAMRREFKVAGQNIWTANKFGAFTGEVTAPMLKDFGIEWVLVGHSERRHIMGETCAMTVQKVQAALACDLNVVLCIGETLEEREANKTMEVCMAQLACIAEAIDAAQWAKLVVAYEPVWAIGTGKVATAEQAQEVHAALRKFIADKVSADVAAGLRIVYGGSVKPHNCEGLIAGTDVDGFLVGGASLKPDFLKIIASASGKTASAL